MNERKAKGDYVGIPMSAMSIMIGVQKWPSGNEPCAERKVMGHIVAVRIVTTDSDSAQEIKDALEQAIDDVRDEVPVNKVQWSVHTER